MKTIAPAYYQRFECIKGACRHSCCIGWEIDVDPDTMQRYQAVPGEMGKKIRAGIDAENACFRLDAEERCPFLNSEGLCDIILSLGEENLCQICADHPRFRSFYADRTEIGLGLCCEAAARLILAEREPLRLIVLEDDGADEPSDQAEMNLLALRAKWMQSPPQMFSEDELRDWASFLMELEHLDDAWPYALRTLQDTPTGRADDPAWEQPFQRFYEYLLYRHIPGALDDGDLPGRVAFAGLIFCLVKALFDRLPVQDMDGLVELCRLYSSEIEYSDENVGAILDRLDERNGA